MGNAATVGTVVIIFVALLVGATLIEPFADEIEAATNSGNSTDPAATNVTGASETIVNLLPLFFVLVIIAAAVRWGSKYW